MRKESVCVSLVRDSYQFGAPIMVVLPCYAIPICLFLIYKPLWITLIVGAVMHYYLYTRYRKDKYYCRDYFQSLKEKDYLEP